VTRVLIAAPSAVVRAGLEAMLDASPDLEVVGSAPGLDWLAGTADVPGADVLLLDLERSADGIASLRSLGPEPDSPAIVALMGSGMSISDTLRQGARAILPREAEAEEIIAAVRAAASGLVVLHPTEVAALLPHLPSESDASERPIEELTPREIEVLGMLAEGAGNKQIARRLGISEHTVKFHVGSILGKLNAASRTEAVTRGIRQGLILV
jgi:two-component system, NarL family, response regulator YdfI